MDHAWLDSLSEDWVSQPRSAGSPVPSFSNSTSSASKLHSSISFSRIPKFDPKQQSWTIPEDEGNGSLVERSKSSNNRTSQKTPQGRDGKYSSTRGRRASTSTTTSSVCHTIQHKSQSLSPTKESGETPEWKRRLIHGEVGYGEQRDLFAPAGLENIFRPPPPQPTSPSKQPAHNFADESVLPSSPPPYANKRGTLEVEDGAERKQPRGLQYKLVEEEQSEFSANDLSYSSNFKPGTGRPEEENSASILSEPASFSSVTQAGAIMDGAVRMVSGQSVLRNEELSPIYVARHSTIDGQTDYTAAAGFNKQSKSIQDESLSQVISEYANDTSQPMPGDMTVGTDDFAHNGHFVNLRRGGRSEEGSFHRRPLSPSSLPPIDESAMLPEESMQASTPKQLPNIRKTRPSIEPKDLERASTPPPVPRTPQASPSKTSGKAQKSSSGSPLKLFGTYDTFTNQKLLRRLSQFEEHFDESEDKDLTAPNGQESTSHELNEAFVSTSSPRKSPGKKNGSNLTSRKTKSFGEGDLDDFQFKDDVSYDISGNSREEDKENISLPTLDPKTQSSFKFHLEPSPSLEDKLSNRRAKVVKNQSADTKRNSSNHRMRQSSVESEVNSRSPRSPRLPSYRDEATTPRHNRGDVEGKRMAKSPLKDPSAKRRRTVNIDSDDVQELDPDTEENDVFDSYHRMQTLLSKKRKDAKHENDQQAANPTVLAMRQILRPRTPTPSQRSSVQRDRAPLQELDLPSSEHKKLLQEQKIAKIQAELDSTAPARLPVALGMSITKPDESRKGSITTQDFLDEAKMIMAGIRGKARPNSGLASLEESESEYDQQVISEAERHQSDEFEDSYQESTKEPFSRPPSREGAPIHRQQVIQQDPALLDHLRKYAEKSDMDDLIASSMRSIAMAKSAVKSAKEIGRATDETIANASNRMMRGTEIIESDPPNIRISESHEMQRKRKHSGSTVQTISDENQDFPSQSSTSSTQSIPTGSSRGSDTRRNIAPHTVSHLIPEQVAGMVLDRDRNIWIKRKTTDNNRRASSLLPSDDDDPFGDIPDLSVDETQELLRLKAVAAKQKQEEHLSYLQNETNYHEEDALGSDPSSLSIANDPSESVASSSHTITGSSKANENDKDPQLIWEDEPSKLLSTISERTEVSHPSHQQRLFAKKETVEEVHEEVEREISIHEDRVKPDGSRRRRNVTITFSSPIASIRQMSPPMSPYRDDVESLKLADQSNQFHDESEEDPGDHSVIITKRSRNQDSFLSKSQAGSKASSRHISLSGHTFTGRPVSRIDEQDEDSQTIDHSERRRSISVVVTTPAPVRKASAIMLATPLPTHEVGTLELTPMSDFTLHQQDSPFGMDVSYVAKNQRYSHGSETKDTLSLTIKQLVEKITEVEPYEPYWESMKAVNLTDKKLSSLHKLDSFCEHLVDLNASRNQISQLNGAPQTLRHLNITHNYISDLTAWGHLRNLQYLDVSNNELESLSGLNSLVHLRGLRADNNKIKSLDGISNLDGLLSLRLRGNMIETLDFSGTKLKRLSDLDVNNNQISQIIHLGELQSLTTLNLESNNLKTFTPCSSAKIESLKYLKLAGNFLETINVGHYPNLRLLYLDGNRINNVKGLLKTKYLDSLSLREQRDGTNLDPSFLSQAFEVRKLFLSGNLMRTFDPNVNFLNLQYLELANCGLEYLPSHFGEMFPNTRVLNLNFNALRDIDSLVGIVRLKSLHLAGNRLSLVGQISEVLERFGSLRTIDLRSNPLNVGFYPSHLETKTLVRQEDTTASVKRIEPFTLAALDVDRDGKYASRLDMGTKMLRRIYELMLVDSCRRLKNLDGLDLDRVALRARDKVWMALVKEGMADANSPPIVSPPPATRTAKEEAQESEPKLELKKDGNEEPPPRWWRAKD